MSLKIDTAKIRETASAIANCNMALKNNFVNVENQVNALYSEWGGAAANSMSGDFNRIKSTFSEARYLVMDNYVRFLYEYVGDTYDKVEGDLESIASQFK